MEEEEDTEEGEEDSEEEEEEEMCLPGMDGKEEVCKMSCIGWNWWNGSVQQLYVKCYVFKNINFMCFQFQHKNLTQLKASNLKMLFKYIWLFIHYHDLVKRLIILF